MSATRRLAVLLVVGTSLACGGLGNSFEQAKQQALDSAKEAVQREIAERVVESLIEGSDVELGEDGSLASFEADGIDLTLGPDAEVPDALVLRPPEDATLVAAGNAESDDGRSIDFALAGIPSDTEVDPALDAYAAQLEADGWTLQPLPEGQEPAEGAPRVVHAEKNGERAFAFVVEAGAVDPDAPPAKQIALLQVRSEEPPSDVDEPDPAE